MLGGRGGGRSCRYKEGSCNSSNSSRRRKSRNNNNKIKKKEIIIIKIINDNKKGRNTIDNTRATAILQYNCLQSSVAAVNHYFHCGYSLSVVYITLIRHSIRC